MQLCRAGVQPCLSEIHVSPGERFTLGIRLNVNDGDSLNVVGWATHFQVADTSVVTMPPSETGADQVQKQGSESLVLDSLSCISDHEAPSTANYFTVQVRKLSCSGCCTRVGTTRNIRLVNPRRRGPQQPNTGRCGSQQRYAERDQRSRSYLVKRRYLRGNAVDAIDLAAMKSSFRKLGTEDRYEPAADLDRDGVIDVQDFSRIAKITVPRDRRRQRFWTP